MQLVFFFILWLLNVLSVQCLFMCNAEQSLAVSDVQLIQFIHYLWHFVSCDTVEPQYNEHRYNGYSDIIK